MLHVALAELARGRPEQVLAGQGGLGVHQRHRVLELVAEPVGPAGLIEPRPAPDPAAQVWYNSQPFAITFTDGSGVSTFTAPRVRFQ
jgi:hypothetical protein